MSLQKRQVRTLIGHQQVETGLKCLPSLSGFSRESMTLLIHDDGTLSDEDCDRLIAALPGASIVRRPDADARIEPLLARYPKCRQYRQHHPLGLKLLDMALFEPQELAYCDSDILFLKSYTGLFKWPGDQTSAIFMQDIQDAYSLHPWHVYPFGKIRVPQKINSGLILFRTSVYDLEFIEWFLGQKRLESVFKKRAHWIEQTCWAALGRRVGCYAWNARQFIIATPDMVGLSSETVGIHFVAAARSKLLEFYPVAHSAQDLESAVVIECNVVQSSTPLQMSLAEIRKRL
jgi:hypothetical protein